MIKLVRAVFFILIPLLFSGILLKNEWHKIAPEKEVPEPIRTELIRLAENALEHSDVPVGAVVVYQNTIIGRGFNTVKRDSLASGHAEVNALNDAMKRTGYRRFMDMDRNALCLYSTYIPCEMCFGTLQHYNIRKVYYMKGHSFLRGFRRDLKALYNSIQLKKTSGEALQDSLFRLHPEYPGK